MPTNANLPAFVGEFGRRLRHERERHGLSQMKLAEQAGLHFTYISSAERGLRNVSLVNIVRLADALDIDPAELVRGLKPGRPRGRR